MSIKVYCEVCNASYPFDDKLAGKAATCPKCQSKLTVPDDRGPAAYDDYADEDEPRPRKPPFPDDLPDEFARDKFLLRQKLWSLKEKYNVADKDGESILFVERPVHLAKGCLAMAVGIPAILILGGLGVFVGISLQGALGEAGGAILAGVLGLAGFLAGLAVVIALYPKRHITFYPDEAKEDMLLRVFQNQKVAFLNMRYTLADDTGRVLCVFRKSYLHDVFRKRWYIEDEQGNPLFVVKEDSVFRSLMRRTIGAAAGDIPVLALLLIAFRTNFIFTRVGTGEKLGEFNRRATLLDRYVLDMTADEKREIDRRIAVAMGVLLDTGEKR